MSLEESDDLIILDVEPVSPVLEVGSLPKFDMHLHKSSITETQVKWLAKCYGVPEDLHPRVALEGMTMNALPNDAIGLYAYHFQQGGLRVPFSSFFKDIIPTVPLFRVFYKLCKQGNWFSFQNRVGKNYKPYLKDAPTSLKKWKDKILLVDRRVTSFAMAWRHHDSSIADPFPKSNEYNASDVTKLREVVIALRKPHPSLLYVAGLSHVWKYADRAFSLKDPKGKVVTMAEFLRLPNFKGCKVAAGELLDMVTTKLPCHKVIDDKEKNKRKAKAKAAVDAPGADILAERVVRDKGHVSSPIPLNHAKPLEILANEEYASLNASAGRMGAMRNQTDEHATPPIFNAGRFMTGRERVQENVDATFSDEGHGDNEGGLSGLQTQPSPSRHAGPLLETVEKPVRDKVIPPGVSVIYLSLSNGAWQILPLKEALKQSEADAHELRLEKERYAIEAGSGEMLGEAFSLAIGKGFIDGISIGCKDPDIQAILKATLNVNPASANIFMETYEKLFDKRYPYVDKVARTYLLDPNGLQNVMPDETGLTPGGGPRDTPTTSYA
ncbi:hypothetical protein Tco_0648703 [Tanacetum coccineum]